MVAERSLTVKIDADAGGFIRGLSVAAAGARAFRKEVEGSNDRMTFLVQTGLALGPALIPTFAALTPAVAGFANALAFSAIAGGTAVLAFQGIGDSLKKLNDFALDPTEAHLKAATIAMEKLGPAGQDFVFFLQSVRPEMQKLQDIAQEGMLPGVQEGIEEVMTQFPLVKGVIEEVSTALGDISASAGKALTSPFWTDFLGFIQENAQTVLTSFASAIGHLIEGLAALSQAFGPMSVDFLGWLDDAAKGFSAWAQGLDQTRGFQDFLAYIQEAGPVVGDALKSLGNALLELTEAASGVGIASLKVIGAIADTIAAVASSPAGPVLIAFAAGISAVSRAMALWTLASGGTFTKTVNAMATQLSFATTGSVQNKNIITGARTFAAATGLIALSLTDLDDSIGFTNTATFAAVGAMLGPWGVAAGGAAGFVKDWTSANNALVESLERIDQAASRDPFDFAAQSDAIKAASTEVDNLTTKSVGLSTGASRILGPLGKVADLMGDHMGDAADKGSTAISDEQIELGKLATASVAFSNQLKGLGTLPFTSTLEEAQDAAAGFIPQLLDAGYSIERIETILRTGVGWDQAITDIKAYIRTTESVPHRQQSVADAIAAVGGAATDAATETETLGAALDALLDPSLNAEEAMDTFKTQLQGLSKELKSAAGFTGFTKGAVENRAATRETVANLKDVLVTQIEAKASSMDLARTIAQTRSQFIAEGVAAGFSAERMRHRANEIGLTPRLVRTVFEALGLTKVDVDAANLIKRYNAIPKSVRTKLEADGVQPNATVDSLMRKYAGLSRADAKTIIRALDNASPVIASIQAKLGALPSNKDILITLRQNTINTVTDRHLTTDHAAGGYIMGPGTGTSDSIPAMLSDGEFVVNAAATARNLDLLLAINAQRFAKGGIAKMADGGVPGRPISAGEIGRRSINPGLSWITQLATALGAMRKEARDVERSEDRLARARDRTRNVNQRTATVEHRLEQLRKKENHSKELEHRLNEQLRHQHYEQKQATKNQAQAEEELTKQRDQLSKATDKWKQKQQELISQAAAISSTVLAQGAIFGGEGTSLSVGGMLAKLRAANKDASQFNHFIRVLRGMGLPESMVQELLAQGPTPEGLAAAKNLAHASGKQIRQLAAQTRRLDLVAGQTGALGINRQAGVNVNMRIDKVVTTDVHALARELPRNMRKALRVALQK